MPKKKKLQVCAHLSVLRYNRLPAMNTEESGIVLEEIRILRESMKKFGKIEVIEKNRENKKEKINSSFSLP